MSQQQLPVVIIGAGPVGLAAAAHVLVANADAARPRSRSRRRRRHSHAGGTCACSRRGGTTSTRRRRRSSSATAGRGPTAMRIRPGTISWSATWSRWPALPELAPHIRVQRACDRRRARDHDLMKDGGASRGAVRRAGGRSRRRARHPGAGRDRRLRHHRDTRRARRIGPAGDRRAGARPTASSTAFPTCSARIATAIAGRRVLVVGSGHSALNALLDLATARRGRPDDARSPGRCAGRRWASCSAARAQRSARGARQARRARAAAARCGPAASSSPASGAIASPAGQDGIVVSAGDARPAARRRDHRRDRIPARLVDPVGGAAGSRSGGRRVRGRWRR